MEMWTIHTGKKSIFAVMKPYQYEIISRVLEQEKNITTGTMHTELERDGVITSRASVINFLKFLAAEDLVDVEMRSGKGGYHSVYSSKMNFEEILTHIVNQVLDAILQAFPRSEYIKYLKSK